MIATKTEARVRRWIDRLQRRYEKISDQDTALVLEECPKKRFRPEEGDAFVDPLPIAISKDAFERIPKDERPTIQSRGNTLLVKNRRGDFCLRDFARDDKFYRETYTDAAKQLDRMAKLMRPKEPKRARTPSPGVLESTQSLAEREMRKFRPIESETDADDRPLMCDPNERVATRFVSAVGGKPSDRTDLASKREIRTNRWYRPLWLPDDSGGVCVDATKQTANTLQRRFDPSWYHDIDDLTRIPDESKPTDVDRETVSDASLYMDAALCAQRTSERECTSAKTDSAPFGMEISPANRCLWRKSATKGDVCMPRYLTQMPDERLRTWYERFRSVEREYQRRQKRPEDLTPAQRTRRLYRYPVIS